MRTIKLFSAVLFVACLFLIGTPSTWAQGTSLGTIRGTVTDQNGSVLPNVSVQITDVATGLARDLTSNSEGEYEATALKYGSYKVTATANGFKKTAISVSLNSSDTIRVNVQLEVGEANMTVDIVGDAAVIQTESPAIANTITNRQLIEIPRDSRDVYEFLYLNPDITQGPNGDGSFKFIGAQSYGAQFSLDGQRSNGGIFGEPTSSQPSLETIGELTVLSKNFTAEYAGIANVRIVTKRGEKDYHGSLFYNNKNSALAAWTVQDKNAAAAFLPTPALSKFQTPYFNLNETGGSFSGRVPFSQKTFFMTSYERRWDFAPLQLRSNQIPTTRIFGGDFTALDAGSRPLVPAQVLPLLTAQELASNTFQSGTTLPCTASTPAAQCKFNAIPQRLLNPVALNVLKFLPQTNPSTPFSPTTGRLVDYVQNLSGLRTRDLVTARVDHDFSDKDKVYFVYNFQAGEGFRSPVANPLPSFGLLNQTQRNHTLSASYTRVSSAKIVNELRGGFNIQNLFRKANQTTNEFLQTIGFNASEISSYGSIVGPGIVDTPGQVAFTIGAFQGIPSGGRNVNRPLDQHLATFGDTLTWISGNHSLKFGADFVKNQAVDGFAFNRNDPRGSIIYPASMNGFAQFLIGLPPSSVRYTNKVRPALDVSNWENGFFAQDDWKITPNITLNLGLRYEYITPYTDKNDLLINFDPNGTGNNGNKGRFIVPSEKAIPNIDQRFVDYGVVTADTAGVGRGLVNTDKNNLAPRFGIAWRLNDRTVLRGGYGVFYPTSAAQGMRDAFASSAFNQRITLRSTAAAPLGGLPGGINPRGTTPFSGGTVQVQGVSINAIPFNLQSPRIEQFNATFERELKWDMGLRVSYVGSRMHNLIAGVDLNELAPNSIPFGVTNEDGDLCTPGDDCIESPADVARRPFPALGSFLASYGNTGKGHSNALQIEVNRRFASGLTFNFSYTLLDQKTNGLDVGNSSLGGALYNQFKPNNDFSQDSFVSRQRFVSYGAYDLPYGHGRTFGKETSGWVDAVAGGWQLTWNMFAKSGTGFTPYWACNNCDPVFPGNIGSGFVDAIGDFSGPTFRPRVLGDPRSGISGDQVVNPTAFAVPSAGADVFDDPSVAKRNALVGPGTWGVNLGIHKFFRFKERFRFEVGADFNNVFNHPLQSPLDNAWMQLGDFDVALDPKGNPVITNVNRNPDFGRANLSFSQEGIDNRRSIRLRLRLTF